MLIDMLSKCGKFFFVSVMIIYSILSITGCSTKTSMVPVDLIERKGEITSEIFHAKTIGDYKITIYKPIAPSPDDGWPVIYLLDGDSFFTQAVLTVKKQLNQAIVVAIDYPQQSRRDRDYLPHPPELALEILSNGHINIPSAYGGADDFLLFFETELKPHLYQNYAIDQQRQTIFGHSLGGLWVLHTLFTQPNSFTNYIASSPSIWFSDRYIMQEADTFIKQVNNLPLIGFINLAISVGEFEQSLTGQEKFATEKEKQLRLKHLQNRRMVDNTHELADKLFAANIAGLNVSYRIYQGKTHQTVGVNALNDGITLQLN